MRAVCACSCAQRPGQLASSVCPPCTLTACCVLAVADTVEAVVSCLDFHTTSSPQHTPGHPTRSAAYQPSGSQPGSTHCAGTGAAGHAALGLARGGASPWGTWSALFLGLLLAPKARGTHALAIELWRRSAAGGLWDATRLQVRGKPRTDAPCGLCTCECVLVCACSWCGAVFCSACTHACAQVGPSVQQMQWREGRLVAGEAQKLVRAQPLLGWCCRRCTSSYRPCCCSASTLEEGSTSTSAPHCATCSIGCCRWAVGAYCGGYCTEGSAGRQRLPGGGVQHSELLLAVLELRRGMGGSCCCTCLMLRVAFHTQGLFVSGVSTKQARQASWAHAPLFVPATEHDNGTGRCSLHFCWVYKLPDGCLVVHCAPLSCPRACRLSAAAAAACHAPPATKTGNRLHSAAYCLKRSLASCESLQGVPCLLCVSPLSPLAVSPSPLTPLLLPSLLRPLQEVPPP